jgi:hypothetical protein
MSRVSKILIVSVLILFSFVPVLATPYIPTPQDTKLPPAEVSYERFKADQFELLYDTEFLSYFFRDDRDIIAILDKRNGYTWKTGLDLEFNRVLEEACDLVPEDQKINCLPLEDRLNTTFVGIANSLLTIEYYDSSSSIRRLSSASDSGVFSRLATINNNPAHRRLDVNFTSLDIQISVHIYLDESGIQYEIKDEEIKGSGVRILAAVLLTPFMGASGGAKAFWDPEQFGFRRIVANPKLDGYVLVPDGPGALIRFMDYNTSLTSYNSRVYGNDLAKGDYFYSQETSFLPLKSPTMPVFGIAHGNRQAAFVAYAQSGGEYMNIIVSPKQNLTNYTFAYPRFEFNKLYHQVYNRRGDGYFKLMDTRNHYNISMRYDFLANDGSQDGLPADYVGMALKYRNFLQLNNGLPTKERSQGDVPVRLDFVMSDIKRSVFGLENVVVTTVEQVRNILEDVKSMRIHEVSSGLLGWQKGGITGGHPARANFSSAIGTRRDFIALNEFAQEIGYDISTSQDYVTIHREQVNYLNTAAKHMNGWYLEYRLRENMPVTLFGLARPSISARWLLDQSRQLSRAGLTSLTLEGISNVLISEYSREGMEVGKTIKLYQETIESINQDLSLAATAPNNYLWKYLDRFLQAPVYSSQFLIQTDTVPFLQLVINNNMEMFAPYSNFSFYTQQDVLRMIDYNLFPSFVLTHQPSYQLSLTNSARFYSTEYVEYKALIEQIYHEINDSLKHVKHAEWIDRQVLANGVIMNRYDNQKIVIINYTQEAFVYRDTVIDATSAKTLDWSGQDEN